MELEATLIDKMQKALTKVCGDCGKVTGQSLNEQLLGGEIECVSCRQRNRMLYLPIKILLMKFTSMFGITEAELLSRMTQDTAWNHLLDLIFKGLASGRSMDDLVSDTFPFVVGLDLDADGKGVALGDLDAVLDDYRQKGTVGVRFYKKEPFTGDEMELIRTTKEHGFLVSLAIRMPASVRIGELAGAIDHVDLLFDTSESFSIISETDIKEVLGGTILKPISLVIEEDLVFPQAAEKAKELSRSLSPDALLVRPKEPLVDPYSVDDVPPELNDKLEMYASLMASPEVTPFMTVRDPGFVRWLGRSPDAASVEDPPIVVFKNDMSKWSLPPDGFLPVKSVFSLVPMHVGINRGAFYHRIRRDELF